MVCAVKGGVQRGRGGIKGPAKECGEQRKRREERNDQGGKNKPLIQKQKTTVDPEVGE